MLVTVSTYGSALSRTITALAKCHQKQPRGRGSREQSLRPFDRIGERKCLLRFRQAVPSGNLNRKQFSVSLSENIQRDPTKLNGKRWYCTRYFVSRRISPLISLMQRFIMKFYSSNHLAMLYHERMKTYSSQSKPFAKIKNEITWESLIFFTCLLQFYHSHTYWAWVLSIYNLDFPSTSYTNPDVLRVWTPSEYFSLAEIHLEGQYLSTLVVEYSWK